MGLPPVLVGSEKTGGTSGTCAGCEGARHPIVHLDLGWLPRHHVPLVSIIQHCDMDLPSLAIDRVWLHLP